MNVRSYSAVTASYWGFTVTDGALRMLVLFYFHQLGYSPVKLAYLFLLYEAFGVVTNLFGGWIGSRLGLKFTLHTGLALQIISLIILSGLNPDWGIALSVYYVMFSQALSGIAKDLTKMSSKSAIKLLVSDQHGTLFKWVAILTGSKNALKGVGFLLGGLLLTNLGFRPSLWLMAGLLTIILLCSLFYLSEDIGKSKQKVKLKQLLSKTRELNLLSSARLLLFAARDIWFVVALPVFLKSSLGWSFNAVGAFMASWVIGYGIIQAYAPRIIKKKKSAAMWAITLSIITALLATAIQTDFYPVASIFIGLSLFGIIFALNSSLHSYLVLTLTNKDQVSVDVGFYYMANACGRLLGTFLSGSIFLIGGLNACLWTSAIMLLLAGFISLPLRQQDDLQQI